MRNLKFAVPVGHQRVQVVDEAGSLFEGQLLPVGGDVGHHGGHRVLVELAGFLARLGGVGARHFHLFQPAAVKVQAIVLVSGQQFAAQFRGGRLVQQRQHVAQLVEVVGRLLREYALIFQYFAGQGFQRAQARPHRRIRLDVSAGILGRFPARAHLGHRLFGVEQGVVPQFGPRAQGGQQLLAGPGGGAHERRVARVARVRLRQAGQHVNPAVVHRAVPVGGLEGFETRPHLLQLGRVILVARLPGIPEDIQRRVAAQPGQQVEPARQRAGLCGRADLAVNEALKGGPVEREALAHQAEPLGLALTHVFAFTRLGDDKHAVDLRHRQRGEGRLKALQGSGVGKGPHLAARRLFQDAGILGEVEVVAFADQQGGGVVHPAPELLRLGVVGQQGGQQRRRARLTGFFYPQVHAPEPLHGPEIALQGVAAGVVPARNVLRVVLRHFTGREDARRGDALMGLDFGQFGLHDALHGCRNRRRRVAEAARHCEVRHRVQRVSLQRCALQCLPLLHRVVEQQTGHFRGRRYEGFTLQVAQHLVEHQVVDVQHAVGRHEGRLIGVTALLVGRVELSPTRRSNHEPVAAESRLLSGVQSGQLKVFVALEDRRVADLPEVDRQGVGRSLGVGQEATYGEQKPPDTDRSEAGHAV
ncbi:hypothetical protein DERA104750_03580 [Deinococcus radiodurans]